MTADQAEKTAALNAPWTVRTPTALLVLADGTVIEGFGLGATGAADGEVCFNTAMTGYQEILTDPSYAGQILVATLNSSSARARMHPSFQTAFGTVNCGP